MQYLSTVFSLTVITFLSRSLVSSSLTNLSMVLALTSLYCLEAICLTSVCSFFRMEVMNFRLLKALYCVMFTSIAICIGISDRFCSR